MKALAQALALTRRAAHRTFFTAGSSTLPRVRAATAATEGLASDGTTQNADDVLAAAWTQAARFASDGFRIGRVDANGTVSGTAVT